MTHIPNLYNHAILVELDAPPGSVHIVTNQGQRYMYTLFSSHFQNGAGSNYRSAGNELQSRNPHISRGLSERSVRRFVSQHGLHVTSKHRKEEALAEAIEEVRLRIYITPYSITIIKPIGKPRGV